MQPSCTELFPSLKQQRHLLWTDPVQGLVRWSYKSHSPLWIFQNHAHAHTHTLPSNSRMKWSAFHLNSPCQLDAILPQNTKTVAFLTLLASVNAFIVSSFIVRTSTGSESPPTPPIFKNKMKEFKNKMGKNVINVTCQNLLVKRIKYYCEIEIGKKWKNIIKPL